MMGLILGTAGMGAFVGVQIAQEGRTAVRAVTEALPTWQSDGPEGSPSATALTKQVQSLASAGLLQLLSCLYGPSGSQSTAVWLAVPVSCQSRPPWGMA